MKGYKVFNENWTCMDKQYTCPGEFTQAGKLELCKNGIHFCKDVIDCFRYYDFTPRNHVAEIEAIGKVLNDNGNKYCTNHIKVIKELNWHEVLDLVNSGKSNTGMKNSGNYNTGIENSGNYNTGNLNVGDHNTGDMNVGIFNTGDCNEGRGNSGDLNFGHYNTGNSNFGWYNTGHNNKGNSCIGDWNFANFSFGFFNTEEQHIYLFNHATNMTLAEWDKSEARNILYDLPDLIRWEDINDMTDEEKEEYSYCLLTNGYLKAVDDNERQNWWNHLSEEKKQTILNLPYFDSKIFYKCTGIDVNANI